MQTTTASYLGMAKALQGQLDTINENYVVAAAAQAAVKFGAAVVRGTEDDTCTPITAVGDVLGIAIRTHTIENLPDNGNLPDAVPEYPVTKPVSVLRRGRIHVKASGTVTQGQLAYVVIDGGAEPDAFTATSTNNQLVGRFMESGADGEIVAIEIDLV